ncbi:hypothetical protein Cgig2_026204 [Carnegiea gigantea]|uniref:Uncharacterized protein n=1 Tax=Carnegiea gigantea TaxID=171969 RepID=A0A9Q1GUH6_9CARY|nr:hypothetical protein Cgig2_026204 [Carnegiea gigantea]
MVEGCSGIVILKDRKGETLTDIGLLNDSTTASTDLHACHIVASLVDGTSQANFSWRLSSLEPVPTILEWSSTDVPTNKLAVCHSSKHARYCYCTTTFQGNAYLPDGCEGTHMARPSCIHRIPYHCFALSHWTTTSAHCSLLVSSICAENDGAQIES